MKTFKARNIEFKTNNDWTGLWAPVSLVGGAEDGKVPGFRQVRGTAQAYGEYEVRRDAREIVNGRK